MERKERRPPKMSVPQFGGWEHKSPGVPTDYSMVFNQARANKKNQKTDLTEVRRLSNGNERDALNPNHRRGHGDSHNHSHGRGYVRGHGHGHDNDNDNDDQEDPPVMRRRRKFLSYMTCFRP